MASAIPEYPDYVTDTGSRSPKGSSQGSQMSRSPEGSSQGSQMSTSEGSSQGSKTHSRKGKKKTRGVRKGTASGNVRSRRAQRGFKPPYTPRSRSASPAAASSRAKSTAPCDEELYADMDYIYQFLHNKQIIVSPKTNSSKLKPSAAAFEAATPYVNLQAQIEAGVFNSMQLNIPTKIRELETILPILQTEIANAARQPLLHRKLVSIYENETERLENLIAILAEINETKAELINQTILSSAQLEAIPGVNPPRDSKIHNLAAIKKQLALLESIALVIEAQIELKRDDPTVQFTTGDVSKIVAPAPAVSQIHPAAIKPPATQIPTKVENLDTVDEFLQKTISVINRLNKIAMDNLTSSKRSELLKTDISFDKLKRLLFEMIQLLPNEEICARWQLLFLEMSDILDSNIMDKKTMLNALIDSEFQILLNQFYNEIHERKITQTSARSGPGRMLLVSLNDDVLEQLVDCKSRTEILSVLQAKKEKVIGIKLMGELLVIQLGNYHVRFEKDDIHKLLAVLEPLRSELTLNEQTGIDQFHKLYPTKTQKIINSINALLQKGIKSFQSVFTLRGRP